MPIYEYHCRTCATTFDKLRPMADAEKTAVCPDGHEGATRTLALFAAFTRGASGEPEPMMMGGGCGCGGGGCACHAGPAMHSHN